jgi:hypothetical protein
MILIYSLHPLNKREMDNQRNLLKERLSPFFITDDDFLYSTESNPQLLKEVIHHHKVYLFITKSIAMMGFSPKVLSDLITYMLKNKCCFRSEIDNLSIGEEGMDDVEPMVSEILKKTT